MAVVWGHTSGTAIGYLEPRYLSKSDTQRFHNAEEMIALLRSFFLLGNKQAESRAKFHHLTIDKDETFPAFKARFLSAAVKGFVSKLE
jgi:hypothetical protein